MLPTFDEMARAAKKRPRIRHFAVADRRIGSTKELAKTESEIVLGPSNTIPHSERNPIGLTTSWTSR